MNPTIAPTARLTPPAMPLALIFSSQLLLAEKTSVTREVLPSGLGMITIAVTTALIAQAPKDTREYRHYGIND